MTMRENYANSQRLIFHTVPTLWTPTCQDRSQQPGNHTTSWMTRHGRRYLAQRFSTHQGQDCLREQSGSQIFPSFRKGTSASGANIVYFSDGEACLNRSIHDLGCLPLGQQIMKVRTCHDCEFKRQICRLWREHYCSKGKIHPLTPDTMIGG
jgi:hypothetical protein